MPSPPTNDAIRGLSAFGYVFFLLNVLAIAVVHNLDLDVHRALVIEDGWIEYLTAVYLLAAGIALFGASWVESNRIPRILLLIGGVAMLVGAGEEISWGQRIFDYATPDFLADMNRQGEFNVHNIPSVESAKYLRRGVILLCVVSVSAFFVGRTSLFGVCLPTPILSLTFMALTGYGTYRGGPISTQVVLLLTYICVTLFRGRLKLAVAGGATLLVFYTHMYVYNEIPSVYKWREVWEYLFSLCCLFYAAELLANKSAVVGRTDRLRRSSRKVVAKLMGGAWLYIGLPAVVAGCVGLASLAYFRDSIAAAAVERTLARIKAIPPLAPIVESVESADSRYDVYLDQGQLIYVKFPCVDTDKSVYSVYLHVFPQGAISNHRAWVGFDNFDFASLWRDRSGRCVATVTLPNYGIASINTGSPDGSWRATFEFGE